MDSSVETEIANLALTKLGAARIQSIDDDVKAARGIRAIWNLVRDSELRAHKWSFAIRRAQLPQADVTPPWGFSKVYTLPSDFMRLVQVDDIAVGVSLSNFRSGFSNDYSIETAPDHTRAIYTDLGPPLKIRYIWRVEVTGLWDTCFKMAFACRLAMEMCEDLTQARDKRQLAQQEYAAAIRDAIRANAIEAGPDPLPDDTWVLSRLLS